MTRADTFDDKVARCDQAGVELSRYRQRLNDELKAMMMDYMNVEVQVEAELSRHDLIEDASAKLKSDERVEQKIIHVWEIEC